MGTHPLKLTPGIVTHGRTMVWEWPIRVYHWVAAAAITTLFITGLYISSPVFTSNGEAYNHFVMGRFREIHFVSAYALLFSLLLRAYWFFAGNNYARSGVPLFWRASWWKTVMEQVHEYLGVERGPVRLGHAPLAGMAYVMFVGGLGLLEIATGFALYGQINPGGFWDAIFGWVIPLFGGPFRTQMWHHMFAWGFVVFVIMHLYLVIFDSFRYRNGLVSSMISGDKFYDEGDLDSDDWVS